MGSGVVRGDVHLGRRLLRSGPGRDARGELYELLAPFSGQLAAPPGHGRPGRSPGRSARSPRPSSATSRPRATLPRPPRSRSGSARRCSSPAPGPAGPGRSSPAAGPRTSSARGTCSSRPTETAVRLGAAGTSREVEEARDEPRRVVMLAESIPGLVPDTFLASLDSDEWEALNELGFRRSFPRGAILMFQNEPDARVMLLLAGTREGHAPGPRRPRDPAQHP